MSETRPAGSLTTRVIPPPLRRPAIRTVADALRYGGGPAGWVDGIRASMRRDSALAARLQWQEENAANFARSIADQEAVEKSRVMTMIGHLWLAKVDRIGTRTDLGLASCRVVTTAGVNYIVDSFQGTVEPENMKYHGVGTGTTAEATSQTALVTELTTQYAVSGTRPTGSLGEQSGNANVFETAATITVSAAVALTEHGIFSQATTGGVLLDRTLFAAVNLASGESLQATYDLTFTAGG